MVNKVKTKKNKLKEPLTGKKIAFYIVTTIILGGLAYFCGESLAKYVMDRQYTNNQPELSDLTEVETLDNLTFSDFLERFNTQVQQRNINQYQIQEDMLVDGVVSFDDVSITFIQTEQNFSIAALEYKEETDDIKSLVAAIIQANNENITDESVQLLFEKTKETFTEEANSSEYFQYQGIETSLKKNGDLYQFRIGRITKQA